MLGEDSGHSLTLQEIKLSKHNEIITVDLVIRKFEMRLSILNIEGFSPVHGNGSCERGTFGKIFRY